MSATVSGLAGAGLVLRNNAGSDTTVAANGAVTFPGTLTTGGAYAVTVSTQPANPTQICTVSNGSGTVAAANITNVSVACVTNTYPLSVTVSGLAGAGLVLRNNNGNDLAINADGAASFTAQVASGANYSVTVASQPASPSQTCTVANGTGTIATAAVSNVAVACVTNFYPISVSVSNLVGSGLVLQNNNGNDLAINANGAASFTTVIASGANYNVTIASQPSLPTQVCAVANASGTVAGGAITNVAIDCGPALYRLGGTVAGLVSSVTLANGATQLVVDANGTFTFPGTIPTSSNYSVTVAVQPPDYTCTVANASGTIINADIANVAVNCAINLPGVPVVTLSEYTKRFEVRWTRPARAAFYRVYKKPDTSTDYAIISGDLLTDTFNDDIGVHLENFTQLRYRVDACNVSGCTPSVPSVPPAHLPMIGYFKASNSHTDDWFGQFTAVSGDGNTIAIAAPSENGAANTINGNQAALTAADSGAVYVYMRDAVLNRWVQQAYVKASGSVTGLAFGWGLALSHDGNTLAVGAYHDSTGASLSGSVYVYSRNPVTSVWTEEQNLRATNFGQDDYFGFSLAIAADGNTLVVGAPGESSDVMGVSTVAATNNNASNSGAAYVFRRAAGVWTQRDYIKASNTGNSDSFGSSVAISSDGSTIAISAPGEDSGSNGVDGDQNNSGSPDSGAVYVFTQSGNSWIQQSYLKSPDSVPHASSPGDALGAALALSGNGDTLAVSSIHESSNARGIGGDPSNNAAQESGAAYVFARSGGMWSHQAYIKASNSDPQDVFGFSLDLSDDGNIMAIGARSEGSAAEGVGGDQTDNSAFGSGAVYSFRRNGATWAQVNYVHARSTDPIDLFGCSLSLSADGKTMIVGAYGEDGAGTIFNDNASSDAATESGAAYIF